METITIDKVLDELINQQKLPLEKVIDRYFSPSYRQRTNGCWEDREGFAQHARKLREICAFARIDVLDELRERHLYATRHRVLSATVQKLSWKSICSQRQTSPVASCGLKKPRLCLKVQKAITI